MRSSFARSFGRSLRGSRKCEMAVDWPLHLVERIAADQWALFIGSGASASCRNDAGVSPPTWIKLLNRLTEVINDQEARQIAEQLIARRELLAAADHIRYVIDGEHNLNTYLTRIKQAVEGPPGDLFKPSSFYDELLGLEPRVVFTTNYDKLFETASSNGYASHKFDSL